MLLQSKATQITLDPFWEELEEKMVHNLSYLDNEEWHVHAQGCRVVYDMGIEDLRYERDSALEELTRYSPGAADRLRALAQCKARKWWCMILRTIPRSRLIPILIRDPGLRANGPLADEALYMPPGTFGPGMDRLGRVPEISEIYNAEGGSSSSLSRPASAGELLELDEKRSDSRGITGPVAVAPYLLRQDKKISMFAPRERDEGLEQLGHKGIDNVLRTQYLVEEDEPD